MVNLDSKIFIVNNKLKYMEINKFLEEFDEVWEDENIIKEFILVKKVFKNKTYQNGLRFYLSDKESIINHFIINDFDKMTFSEKKGSFHPLNDEDVYNITHETCYITNGKKFGSKSFKYITYKELVERKIFEYDDIYKMIGTAEYLNFLKISFNQSIYDTSSHSMGYSQSGLNHLGYFPAGIIGVSTDESGIISETSDMDQVVTRLVSDAQQIHHREIVHPVNDSGYNGFRISEDIWLPIQDPVPPSLVDDYHRFCVPLSDPRISRNSSKEKSRWSRLKRFFRKKI